MLRCTWCCKDTRKKPCEHCGSDVVFDPYKEHTHQWSRKTINTMECLVCDLEVQNHIYFSGSAPEKGAKEKPENEKKPETKEDNNAEVRSGTDALPPTPSGEGDKNRSGRKTRPRKKAKPDLET